MRENDSPNQTVVFYLWLNWSLLEAVTEPGNPWMRGSKMTDYLEFNKENYYKDIISSIEKEKQVTFNKLFLRLHDRDKIEVFNMVADDYKKNIANLLPAADFEDMFKIMAIEDQEVAVANLPNDYLRQVFNHLPYDDIAYFINRSSLYDDTFVLKYLDADRQKEVLEILSYASETAGSIMTKEFISVYEDQTVQRVIDYLRQVGQDAETIYTIYVVDDKEQLNGVFSLRELMMSPKDKLIADIMNTHVVSASVDMDQEDVAVYIQDYDLTALPVISHDGKLKGIITVDDIIDIVDQEAEEDFNELAGIRKQDTHDEKGKQKSTIQMALSRTPWLVIFMVSGLLIGSLMNLFEDTLQRAVLLSAFVPAIMDTAGNVGTQSLAVTISGSKLFQSGLGQKLLALKDELLTGLIMGVISALMMFVIISVVYGEALIGLIVALALIVTVTISTGVGLIVPLVFDKIGFDSSVASGPFITIISDAVGLVFYFSIASIFIG